MTDKNALGERGEKMFYVAATEFHGASALFRPNDLGAKWPVADYVVEVSGKPGRFFAVQVKTSQRGRNPAGHLQISASKKDIAALLKLAVPAYIVGVDEPTGNVYIARPLRAVSLSSIPTTHSLADPAVRVALRDEVNAFWAAIGAPFPFASAAFSF